MAIVENNIFEIFFESGTDGWLKPLANITSN